MRLYMVRRTRSFIQDNYATQDPATGRKFLVFEDGTRSFFPERVAKTAKFRVNEHDPADQYARLYAADVVTAINALRLPRYGLANYVAPTPHEPPTAAESQQLSDLSRAGTRLMGFCRTNLFKRLESSGHAFQQSVERHILRNYVYLHAIEKGLPLPIGTQDAGLLDAGNYDEDFDDEDASAELLDDDDTEGKAPKPPRTLRSMADFKARAAEVYEHYSTQFASRFGWLRTDFFVRSLAKDLSADATSLIDALTRCGDWNPEGDAKLNALFALLTKNHSNEKMLIFTQFADTVRYLETQLRARGLKRVAGVTGNSEDPTSYAWRFSPDSNKKRETITPQDELRVLIATDVLSEGQNLQDASIVVNFVLPWAIIRLIQRAGRVDRIGQKSDKILCYRSCPPMASKTSSVCAPACASAFERMKRSWGRMRLSLKTIMSGKGSWTCITKKRVSWTVMPKRRWTLLRMPIKFGRMRLIDFPSCKRRFPRFRPSSTLPGSIKHARENRTVCSYTCARRKEMMHSPG
jgi:hypothetical protein